MVADDPRHSTGRVPPSCNLLAWRLSGTAITGLAHVLVSRDGPESRGLGWPWKERHRPHKPHKPCRISWVSAPTQSTGTGTVTIRQALRFKNHHHAGRSAYIPPLLLPPNPTGHHVPTTGISESLTSAFAAPNSNPPTLPSPRPASISQPGATSVW